MSQKQETKLQRKIRVAIEEEFVIGFWFKTHGGLFQKKGLPDLLGCVFGLYIGIEIKTDTGKIKAHQTQVLKDIRKAGGLGTTATSEREAIRKIYKHLEKYYGKDIKQQIKKLSEKRSKLRLRIKKGSFVHATWNWENHNSFKGNRKIT